MAQLTSVYRVYQKHFDISPAGMVEGTTSRTTNSKQQQ